ncbi:hypothetical protein ACWEFL_15960 [Streptomyces sp. NPDC004838]
MSVRLDSVEDDLYGGIDSAPLLGVAFDPVQLDGDHRCDREQCAACDGRDDLTYLGYLGHLCLLFGVCGVCDDR